MALGNLIYAAALAVISGAGAALGNFAVASFTVSVQFEPPVVIQFAGKPSMHADPQPDDPACREVDTEGSETRARILECNDVTGAVR